MWNNLVELSKGFLGGFIAFPIAYYTVKNFGAVIWADVQVLWAKYVTKTPVVVTPVVPVVKPAAT